MSCFAIMRGSRDEINHAPIVEGQFFIETDQYDISDLTKYNKIYIDNNIFNRVELGITSWLGLLSKPFDTIDTDTLEVDSNYALNLKGSTWNGISNKPFETIGSTLSVKNGALRFVYEWETVASKPFYTVGYGLNVDSNGNLNADTISVGLSQIGTASSTNVSYQSLTVNNVNAEIIGSKYMEYTQVLDTANDTDYTFSNTDINADSIIEVYTSVWGIVPKNISVSNNTCIVTFPKHDTSNISLTCRIYIL